MNLNELIKLDGINPQDVQPKRVIGIINQDYRGIGLNIRGLCGHASALWRQSSGEIRYTDVSLSGGNEARFNMNIDHDHWLNPIVVNVLDAYIIGYADSKEEAEKLASDFFKLTQNL